MVSNLKKIAFIGSRGYGFSYASAEDMVREFGTRFVRDGVKVDVHGWGTSDYDPKGIGEDVQDGIHRVFHKTPGGKISGQFFVALKASLHAAWSDCDLVCYIFVNSAIFCWIPKLFGKKVFVNIDGIMWKDPKWPPVIRHLFFPLGAYFAIFLADKTITDSYHMQQLYRKKFKVNIDWAGYGCSKVKPQQSANRLAAEFPQGYYLIMSRITPHNLTDVMVEGFIRSGTKSHLVVAGHLPDTKWFRRLKASSEGKNVTFLGLVRNQAELTQIILNSKAYLHGHSLGGINPALVRVVGLDKPAICVDTVFNREVVEYPNAKLQACLFQKEPESVAEAIRRFEAGEEYFRAQARELGEKVRSSMSWEHIYSQYRAFFEGCFR